MDEAEILKQLRWAVRSTDTSSLSSEEGKGEEGREEDKEAEVALDQLLGKTGRIVTGRLLGSPNPLILALSMEGKVFYLSHEDIEKVLLRHATAPIAAPPCACVPASL